MSTPHDEWAAVAERFGADLEQVRRDHLISHVLAAIAADVPTDDLVFFGGTALSRTHGHPTWRRSSLRREARNRPCSRSTTPGPAPFGAAD